MSNFLLFSKKYNEDFPFTFENLTQNKGSFKQPSENSQFWDLISWANSSSSNNFPGIILSLSMDRRNNFICFDSSYNEGFPFTFENLTQNKGSFKQPSENSQFWDLISWANSTIDINTYPFPGNLIPDNNFILFAKESRQLRITLPPTENIESIDSNLSYFTDTNGDVGISSFLTIYFDGPIVFKTGITMPSFEGNQLTYHIGSEYYSLELNNENNVILKNDTIYDIITSDLLDADLPDILKIDIGLGYISDNVKTEDTILYTSDSALDTNAGLYADGFSFNHLNGLFEIVVN